MKRHAPTWHAARVPRTVIVGDLVGPLLFQARSGRLDPAAIHRACSTASKALVRDHRQRRLDELLTGRWSRARADA